MASSGATATPILVDDSDEEHAAADQRPSFAIVTMTVEGTTLRSRVRTSKGYLDLFVLVKAPLPRRAAPRTRTRTAASGRATRP